MIKKLCAPLRHNPFTLALFAPITSATNSAHASASSYPLAAARAFALFALWSVPCSTALTNISVILFAIAALCAPEVWRNARSMLRHPVSVAAILLLLALTLSLLYSVAPLDKSVAWFAKYRKLLFIPLLILVFQGADLANAASRGLCAILSLVLLLSVSNYLGLTEIGPLYTASNPETHAWVFKNRITAGLFSALLFNLAMSTALTAKGLRTKIFYYGLAWLAFANVFVMLQGRTGQLMVMLLLLYQTIRFAWHYRDKKSFSSARLLLLAVLPCALLVGFSVQTKDNRLMQITTEIHDYQQRNEITSSGIRLEWYRRSLSFFIQKPIFGYGVGAVQQKFEALMQRENYDKAKVATNPHNQYLAFAVELGLVGLGLFVNLLFQVARATAKLAAPARELLGSWLFMFALGCLVNSLLLDFSEGYLFVLLSGILLGCTREPLHNSEGGRIIN